MILVHIFVRWHQPLLLTPCFTLASICDLITKPLSIWQSNSTWKFAGATLHHTLSVLGATNIDTYFLPKGENIHTAEATAALKALDPAALIVLDQGSRGGPPICPGVPTLILDHHQSIVFPEEAQASVIYPVCHMVAA